jgi:homocysteine S-methyltransferase
MSLQSGLTGDMIMVCDGAMGTMLHAAGNALDQALPALNLTNPALVKTIHDSYISAGVDIIQTNTFGASRLRLAEHGLDDRVVEINQAGVRIARQAAPPGSGVLVAGSVSPPVTVRQRPRIGSGERVAALAEQIEVLASAGADLIMLETFGHLDEFAEAILVATEVAGAAHIPVIAQATFGPDALTLSGHKPIDVAAAAAGAAIVALGTNCTLGPQRSLAVLRELSEHTDLPLSFLPNAGLPRRVAAARFEYDVDAEYFTRYVRHALEAGATIVGGCCGTTPKQLAATVQVASRYRRQRQPDVAQALGAGLVTAERPPPVTLARSGRQVVIAELTPPLTDDADQLVDLAGQLGDAGVDLISIAASRTTKDRISALDLASHVQQTIGIDTIASVTTWDRTIMALQADLLGVHALGLHRIVCETGTPPLAGDYPHVDGIWDVDSIGLIELLAGLNQGVDYYGLQLGARTGFDIGARINPGSRDLAGEADRALAKIAAGASFLITRPVYEVAGLERLLTVIEDRVPVLAAIRPLESFDEAEYLANEVPDVTIGAATLSALERAGKSGSQSARQAGLELAAELAARVRDMSSGLVITIARDPLTTIKSVLPARA